MPARLLELRAEFPKQRQASEPPAMSLSSEALLAVMVAIINPNAIAIRFFMFAP